MAKFMDVHSGFFGVSQEQLAEAHGRDLAIEGEEGVHYELHTGSILRCELDGSRLEVFATGLRNPQDLVFNALGEVRCNVQLGVWIRPGTVSLPKGLWRKHTANGLTGNALAPDTLTDLGGGACFNDARVEIESVSST